MSRLRKLLTNKNQGEAKSRRSPSILEFVADDRDICRQIAGTYASDSDSADSLEHAVVIGHELNAPKPKRNNKRRAFLSKRPSDFYDYCEHVAQTNKQL